MSSANEPATVPGAGGEHEPVDKRVEIGPNGGVVPVNGWAWCRHCDGQGVVMTMDSGPHLDEHETECGFCDNGLVRDRTSNG